MFLIGLGFGELCTECFTGCFSYFWMLIVYPIIPWFVTDLFFYGTVYLLPIFSFINSLCAIFTNPPVDPEEAEEA